MSKGGSKSASATKLSGQNRSFRQGGNSNNPERQNTKGQTHLRSKATIKRLNMYRSKPEKPGTAPKPLEPKRIEPDRRWFGNTRVISQSKLETFRSELETAVKDPFQVVLRSSKLPMSLLTPAADERLGDKLLQVEPFADTFGAKAQRKKPKVGALDFASLAAAAESRAKEFAGEEEEEGGSAKEETLLALPSRKKVEDAKNEASEKIFRKGTSRRIWQELYKVVDSSDVILEVIDARDPMGTRCFAFERELKKTRPHKHIVLVLNKCDLVPTWVTKKWTAELNKEFPTVAFHASITKSFGKSALLQLLRQFSSLMKDRKHVSVGFVGYPSVGKSSIINTLKAKAVCKASPVPGETKVWQYIGLTKRIYLIDCPGIVPADSQQTDAEKVLKGVVRPEKLEAPSLYIQAVLNKTKPHHIRSRYGLAEHHTWTTADEFLSLVATKAGKLLKGGEPDLETTARVVLYDWQKGRIPYFTPPPGTGAAEEEESTTAAAEAEDAASQAESETEAAEEEKKTSSDESLVV